MVQSDRRFWIGLAGAGIVHILIILGTLSFAGRRMGEPDASPDGVSVVIVDAADLQSRSTVPSEPPPSPPPQPRPAAPPPTPPSEERPQSEPNQPTPPQQAEKAPRQEPLPDTPGDVPPPSQQRQQRPSKQAAARPANPAPAQKPSPVLDLTITPSMMSMSRGGSFMPTRPPGITRSGENDEFGRGVIRALQRTIPQLMNTVGRVTVRIILNAKGNLETVEVIRPSGITTLDQSVIFAAKQSNFPIPPDNATVIDRTFLVTYIYTVN